MTYLETLRAKLAGGKIDRREFLRQSSTADLGVAAVKAITTRNPNFWKEDCGHFEEVETIAINDTTARTNAVQTGEIDVMNRCDLTTVHPPEQDRDIEVKNVAGMKHITMTMLRDRYPFSNSANRGLDFLAGLCEGAKWNRAALETIVNRLQFRDQHCANTPWVFCKEEGSRIKSAKRSFRTAGRRAGIDDFFRGTFRSMAISRKLTLSYGGVRVTVSQKRPFVGTYLGCPKSGHRMATDRMQFSRRWSGGTISLNLGVSWECRLDDDELEIDGRQYRNWAITNNRRRQ